MRRDVGTRANGLGKVIATLALAVALLPIAAQSKKSLVIFPVGLGEAALSTEAYNFETTGTTALLAAANSTEKFYLISYSRTHPGIKRALAEGSIQAGILLPPFTGKVNNRYRAVVLGSLLRADFAVAAAVDSYRYDAESKTVKLSAMLEAYDVKGARLVASFATSVEAVGENESAAAAAAWKKFVDFSFPQAVERLTAPAKPPSGGK